MAPNPSATYTPSEAASVSDDLNDYDVISDADPRSLESSIADLDSTFGPGVRAVREIPASEEAKIQYETAAMSADDVRAFVQRSVKNAVSAQPTRRSRSRGPGEREKTYRVYVDGTFDNVHVGTALQLRQAKLAFPSVYLLVGPFTDAQCHTHEMSTALRHVERCELVRHVRWVDEVLFDAPVVLNEAFLARHRIDYVAVEEGSSVDPAVSKARLAGYDLVKSIGKAILTRRTRNVLASTLAVPRESAVPTPAIPTRKLEDLPPPPPPPPPAPEPVLPPLDYNPPEEYPEVPEPPEDFGA